MAADAEPAGRPARSGEIVRVEIVWVEADGSIGRSAIRLPAGSRVGDALAVLADHERGAALLGELARGRLTAAIFGERCDGATLLQEGDRIELLGPLAIDPKLARRRRAQAPAVRRRGAR